MWVYDKRNKSEKQVQVRKGSENLYVQSEHRNGGVPFVTFWLALHFCKPGGNAEATKEQFTAARVNAQLCNPQHGYPYELKLIFPITSNPNGL